MIHEYKNYLYVQEEEKYTQVNVHIEKAWLYLYMLINNHPANQLIYEIH